MKKFTFIVLLFALLCDNASGKGNQRGRPATLEETFTYLDQMFDDTAKYSFMTLPEDIATIRLHFTLGLYMRNHWGLWGTSKLKRYFEALGVFHPDDMSTIILKSYHRYLNDKPLALDSQVQYYQKFWLAQTRGEVFSTGDLESAGSPTTDDDLLAYFPVDDTIRVSVYETYKRWFSKQGRSIGAIAIVREHQGDSIKVELLQFLEQPKGTPESNVGDEYWERPSYCGLLPPSGWTARRP